MSESLALTVVKQMNASHPHGFFIWKWEEGANEGSVNRDEENGVRFFRGRKRMEVA